ncbi:TPA_asm: DUF4222 domain-containing protein [Salmonella enterica]|nr:DUF4222 domain-containing protein [Salmonella enterica]HAC8265626.1 DUF4222 domain-containing protein [Salmonella enterica]
MFSLIQRGQLYADGDGFPVTIHSYRDNRVMYRRQDNHIRSICLSEFNSTFERLDHREYCQIKAEQEQAENIKNLRKQIRGNKEEKNTDVKVY